MQGTSSSKFSAIINSVSSNNYQDFRKAADILIRLLNNIISDPTNAKYRKFRCENQTIKDGLLQLKGINEVLNEIGFKLEADSYILPSDVLIVHLKAAKDILSSILEEKPSTSSILPTVKKSECHPLKRLKIHYSKSFSERTFFDKVVTSNIPFLCELERLSDMVMQYEDQLLQKTGRKHIPIEKLRLNAIENLRKVQKDKLSDQKKAIEEPILDDLILYELCDWFKNEFMTWVNKPSCLRCKKDSNVRQFANSKDNAGTRVEEYFCDVCKTPIKFYRYNDIVQLLQSRKGRCGEFANLFTFFCRCLGYDARYIFSTEDHVWTEVYSHFQKKWIHIDPSENCVDAPLMYEHGWNKHMRYVIGFSKDDVQDVTWRYSNKHKDVSSRRTFCSEKEFLQTILLLREKRQQNASSALLKMLRTRTICELSDFLIEREATQNEKRGRSSGSLEWRKKRMESGGNNFYVFELTEQEVLAKQFNLQYSCAKDAYFRYLIRNGSKEQLSLTEKWDSLIYYSQNIFKKHEKDWKMVYLAREEETETATIVWYFDFTKAKMSVKDINLRFDSKTYENGHVDLFFLNKDGIRVNDIKDLIGQQKFSIKAVLSKGRGDCAWQHAQLFRQEDSCEEFPFNINIKF